MPTVSKISEIKESVKNTKIQGKTIGLVPTMGYLHEGHLSLIRKASKENDIVVVSVFVNPTQFAPNEDYDKYPRDLKKDESAAIKAGADIIFTPTADEMYGNDFCTYVNVEGLSKVLCGVSRPTHFKGVTTILTKLFNIVKPDKAYFGQKDAQQAIIVKKMVADLNMDIKIVICPIVREPDGLAMSSRNVYLNKQEREAALILSRTLFKTREMIRNGENNAKKVKEFIIKRISSEPLADIDYVEIVDGNTLKNVDKIKDNTLIAIAVKFSNTRLIDNIIWNNILN